MNAITQRSTGALVIHARIEAPPLPDKVAAHVRAVVAIAAERERFYTLSLEARENAFVPRLPPAPALSSAELDLVQRAIGDVEERLQPISLALLRLWLGPVNAGVRNPQSEADFAVRCHGLIELLDDLPAGAFTQDARRVLPGFFPSAADIRQAVEPDARRLRTLLAGLEAARRGASPKLREVPEPRGERSAEALAAVRRTVAAFTAERGAGGRASDLPRVLTGAARRPFKPRTGQ